MVSHRNLVRLFDSARQLFDFGLADVARAVHAYLRWRNVVSEPASAANANADGANRHQSA